MDEASRFVRYIKPGGVYVLEVVGLLFLLYPKWIGDAVLGVKDDAGIGFAVAGVATTGIAGFVLSTVHHALFNAIGPVNYAHFVQGLTSRGLLSVVDATGRQVELTRIGRFEAFSIVTSLWHQLTELSARLKGVDPRAQQLADFTHSLGTTFIACVVAAATTLTVGMFRGFSFRDGGDIARFAIAVVIAGVLMVVVLRNYLFTARMCQTVVEGALTDTLSEQKASSGGAMTTHLTLSDSRHKGKVGEAAQ